MNKGTAGFFLGAMVGVAGTLVYLRLKEEGIIDDSALADQIEEKLEALENTAKNAVDSVKSAAKQLSS